MKYFRIIIVIMLIILILLLPNLDNPDDTEIIAPINCNNTLNYAFYNHTTKQVTYKESEHKICNKQN